MIPNNQPSSLSLRPEGFTTPAPPRGAAPWPTATQRSKCFRGSVCYSSPKNDNQTYFRVTTNFSTEPTATLCYSSAAASPYTPISSSQDAAAAEVNARVSQACLRDLTGGSFFTDASTADTNCAILPLHTAQLSPPLNASIQEDTPVSSLRAGFHFGHRSEPIAALSYSFAAAVARTRRVEHARLIY